MLTKYDQLTHVTPSLLHASPQQRYQCTELNLGRVLGRGGFCVVNEILTFKLEANSPLDTNNGDLSLVDEEEDEFVADEKPFGEFKLYKEED